MAKQSKRLLVADFVANKQHHELSEIRRKKKKNPGTQGTIHENLTLYKQHCRTESSMTKQDRKSSHSSKVRPFIGQIKTKSLPQAT